MKKFIKGMVISVCVIGVIIGMIFYKNLSVPIDLTVMGYVNMTDGLGRQSPELIGALMDEMRINFKHTRKIKHAEYPNEKITKVLKKSSDTWGKVLIFEDIIWSPWDTRNHVGKSPQKTIRFAYSMYESTQIPNEWVSILNQRFDALLVPSSFLIEVYQNSGVQIPIFVVPLGLDLHPFLNYPLKKEKNNPMIFSNFSSASERKNHLTLIRAFHKAFGEDPSVFLRINVRSSEKDVRNAITKELALLENPKNILFTQAALPKACYLDEFRKTDCYVSPSKGEGFSIQPREAMCLGIPVIATNNTGQIPICESGLVKVVESKIREIAINPWGDYYGYHFNCEENDLANALIEVKDHYDEYLKKGEEARKWAAQYQYENVKQLYLSIIKPKKIIFGTENKVTEDFLVTNSFSLFKKYRKAFGKKITKLNNEAIFTYNYLSHEWGENEKGDGFSGPGSKLENILPYVTFLKDFIKKNNITSIVDLGCGDWTFSKHFDWKGINYTGIDVVKSVIEKNKKEFSKPTIQFIHGDATNMNLPEADLLICKEVLQHLSNADIQKILIQIPKFKHCLFTNDSYCEIQGKENENGEIESGALRAIDLSKPPYHLNGYKALEYSAHGCLKETFHISNECLEK